MLKIWNFKLTFFPEKLASQLILLINSNDDKINDLIQMKLVIRSRFDQVMETHIQNSMINSNKQYFIYDLILALNPNPITTTPVMINII